jgi:hypothetical protein
MILLRPIITPMGLMTGISMGMARLSGVWIKSIKPCQTLENEKAVFR